jgi:hypothetical protein
VETRCAPEFWMVLLLTASSARLRTRRSVLDALQHPLQLRPLDQSARAPYSMNPATTSAPISNASRRFASRYAGIDNSSGTALAAPDRESRHGHRTLPETETTDSLLVVAVIPTKYSGEASFPG